MASVSAGENELDYIQMRSLMDIFDNEIQGIGYRAEENLRMATIANILGQNSC